MHGDGKYGQWASLRGWIKWLLTRRIWCQHHGSRYVKKVGDYSKFYCPDCDDFHLIQSTWRR